MLVDVSLILDIFSLQYPWNMQVEMFSKLLEI